MYAIIKTGGKQYRVKKGDVIEVERLEQNEIEGTAVSSLRPAHYRKLARAIEAHDGSAASEAFSNSLGMKFVPIEPGNHADRASRKLAKRTPATRPSKRPKRKKYPRLGLIGSNGA